MILKNNISLFIVLLLAICLSSSADAQKKILFAQGIRVKKEIKISEVASEIKYIPLETTADCLLKAEILDVEFVGGYLFVSDYFNLYQFTPEGKFIRKIGKAGQGPGEYTESMLGVNYDEAKKEIFMSDPRQRKIHVYSFDGHFLRDIKVADGEFIQFRDTLGQFYMISNSFLYDKEKRGKELLVLDEKGKELYNFRFRPIKGERYPGLSLSLSVIYPYKNNCYYKNALETTVYRLEGKKRIPVYEFDLSDLKKLMGEDDGKLMFDKDKNVGTNLPNKAAEKKIYFNNLFETDHYLGILFAQENERRFAWYEKSDGTLCRVRASVATMDGFTDDLSGGIPVFPQFLKRGKMISAVPAAVLLEKVKPSHSKGSLRKVMDNLLEDDNPVVQVVDLK